MVFENLSPSLSMVYPMLCGRYIAPVSHNCKKTFCHKYLLILALRDYFVLHLYSCHPALDKLHLNTLRKVWEISGEIEVVQLNLEGSECVSSARLPGGQGQQSGLGGRVAACLGGSPVVATARNFMS